MRRGRAKESRIIKRAGKSASNYRNIFADFELIPTESRDYHLYVHNMSPFLALRDQFYFCMLT